MTFRCCLCNYACGLDRLCPDCAVLPRVLVLGRADWTNYVRILDRLRSVPAGLVEVCEDGGNGLAQLVAEACLELGLRRGRIDDAKPARLALVFGSTDRSLALAQLTEVIHA